MGQAASGNNLLLGLGRGRVGADLFGIPAPGLIGYGAILPVQARIQGEENDSGQVNRQGFQRAGIPGPKGGNPFTFGHPLTSGHLIELFQQLLGAVVKDSPEPGVFRYVFTPDKLGSRFDLWGLSAQPPVSKELLYGIVVSSLEMEIGDNEEVPVTVTAWAQHGTRLGPAQPVAGNAGAYSLGPWVRGVVADPDAGSIWVRVEQAAPTLQVKALQAAAEPPALTFDGAPNALDLPVDAQGEARWAALRAADTNLDLGLYSGSNKDPLEIVFPGTAAEHAALAVGDVFELPLAWPDPALTEITGHPRLTSAHWLTRFRPPGAPAYEERAVRTGSITLTWTAEPERGNLSRYPFDWTRPGELEVGVELTRAYVDRLFDDAADRHGRLDIQMAFEGPQIGASGLWRDAVSLTIPSARVTNTRNASGEGTTEETATLSGETDDAGVLPVTVEVITTRDVVV